MAGGWPDVTCHVVTIDWSCVTYHPVTVDQYFPSICFVSLCLFLSVLDEINPFTPSVFACWNFHFLLEFWFLTDWSFGRCPCVYVPLGLALAGEFWEIHRPLEVLLMSDTPNGTCTQKVKHITCWCFHSHDKSLHPVVFNSIAGYLVNLHGLNEYEKHSLGFRNDVSLTSRKAKKKGLWSPMISGRHVLLLLPLSSNKAGSTIISVCVWHHHPYRCNNAQDKIIAKFFFGFTSVIMLTRLKTSNPMTLLMKVPALLDLSLVSECDKFVAPWPLVVIKDSLVWSTVTSCSCSSQECFLQLISHLHESTGERPNLTQPKQQVSKVSCLLAFVVFSFWKKVWKGD
ncbi:hypothetical protein VP01_32g7 [Puccinia sorghi]|uniref:Uncharacterized protein n=1 Tax=Puccinia sorghi TaxID=27349 RepID=A0A0L6UXE1_9BASI|nr:hypothetical protein VP01_32g7 [Puccinia sorghi]